MSDLSALLTETTRPTVVRELAELVDTTASSQSGLTGMAIKSALGAVRKAQPDAVAKGIDRFLAEIVRELTPYWEAYSPEQSAGFGNYLASREEDVTSSILKLGDAFVDRGPAPVQKVYRSLRGKASSIVAPALPQLGDIVERHAR
ncbi:DUF6918 family protein [uncultured Corynebacterium sp.]|uniref:DUF6918 family protein n=1 Tax=uncultured Corynebacterium sp. TaxID=159447 RepID=UPI0025930422|nr:hypothetical protein [uncultured Corynebacterium sp.]